MTDKWQSGKTYPPGSLVIPASQPAVDATSAENGDFAAGNSGWDYTGSCTFSSTGGYSNANCCIAPGVTAGGLALNKAKFLMSPGETISANCMIQQGASDVDHTRGYVQVLFFDASDAQIGQPVSGNIVNDGRGGAWHPSSVQATAPAGTSYARCGIYLYQNSADPIWGDNLVVTYARRKPPAGLIFKATQANPGKSAQTEPVWPTSTGVTVTDNEVTWEGVIATRLVWEASPILKSGATEPTWATSVGGAVHDGTIDWLAASRRVEDANCPNTKIVAIAAGKVYAGDDDRAPYSATVNPLDWTSTDDAGFLPFGLNTYGSNPIAAMGLYRSNVAIFNAEGFQMWQVDTDPANTTLLDALPVASTYNKALAPVANDLLFLSSQGVRSIGIAASSTNLQAGDVGMPIDVLVTAKMAAALDEPRATFLPALGQYWIAFNATDRSTCTVFVYTLNQIGQVGKWSRYVFPFPIDGYMMLDDDLYLRSGDDVLRYDEEAVTDFAGDAVREQAFPGIVQYQWLDFGKPGVSKQVMGFDLVGSGNPNFALGYDQTNEGTFTTDFAVPPDTVPGQIIPLPVMAPSMSVRVSYPGGQKWQLQAVSLYLQDMRAGS